MKGSKVVINFRDRSKSLETPTGVALGGRYVLERVIGRGGLGEVLLAKDLQLERHVAVKRIHMDLGESGAKSRLALAEARQMARLQHPNIVTVYDVLPDAGDVVIVMEYLQGSTLEELPAPLELEDFLEICRQSLAALGAAHEAGVIHLDIKSTNLMIRQAAGGRLLVKLLDFGLATMVDHVQELGPLDEPVTVLGSVHTMAPEQFEREQPGPWTDFYSLGCVFFRALSGQDPFVGQTTEEIIEAHLSGRRLSLQELRPELPSGVCQWVEKLLSRNPAERPSDAKSALELLFQWMPDRRRQRTPAPMVTDNPLDVREFHKLRDRVGSNLRVKGTVSNFWQNSTGKVWFLNFQGTTHDRFAVLVPAANSAYAREEFSSLIGREVCIFGEVSDFHGSPQMVVTRPGQISLF